MPSNMNVSYPATNPRKAICGFFFFLKALFAVIFGISTLAFIGFGIYQKYDSCKEFRASKWHGDNIEKAVSVDFLKVKYRYSWDQKVYGDSVCFNYKYPDL